MKLLLAFLLCTVLLGLVTNRLDGRTYASVLALAVLSTSAYFLFARFMS